MSESLPQNGWEPIRRRRTAVNALGGVCAQQVSRHASAPGPRAGCAAWNKNTRGVHGPAVFRAEALGWRQLIGVAMVLAATVAIQIPQRGLRSSAQSG